MGKQGSVAILAVCIACFALGCAHTDYRVSVAPSLRPVDSARPMVVFRPVQGEACGRDAVLAAIRDMKRLRGVDGYLEVVVEDQGEGDTRCAKVTSYPFRYGIDVTEPPISPAEESLDPLQMPGRPSPTSDVPSADVPSAKPVDCMASCTRAAELADAGAIQQALLKDRCLQRCQKGDSDFTACIAAATTQAAMTACLSADEAVQTQEAAQ